MMPTKTVLGAMFLLSTSGLAAAQTPAAVPAPAAAEAASPDVAKAAGVKSKDRIVCRSYRHTGTRFPIRVCDTANEARDKQEAKRREIEKTIMRDRDSRNPGFNMGVSSTGTGR